MTTRQENKFSMYLSTESWLNKNLDKIKQLPHLQDLFAELGDFIQQIKNTREAQETSTKGFAKQKNVFKTTLLKQAELILHTLKAYANIQGMIHLSEEVNYTPSTLKQAADTVLRDICQLLHTKATEHLEALKAYQLTQKQLDDLQKAIQDYAQSIPEPRTGLATKKSVTYSLTELFDKTDSLLKDKIDKLLEITKATDTLTYNAYRNARKMVNLGTRKRKEEEKPTT